MFSIFLNSSIIALFFLASQVSASWEAGEVKVSDSNGVPCYSVISKNGKAMDIYLFSIQVGQSKAGAVDFSESWGIQRKSKDVLIPISNGQCILYGQMVVGTKPLGKSILNPQPLSPGIPYMVNIEAIAMPSVLLEHVFIGRFCIVKSMNGQLIAKEVSWDKQKSRYRDEICETANLPN